MSQIPQSFENIERELREKCSPEEQKMLDAIADRDWQEYQDAVTELYMQKMFRTKIDRVIRRGKGQGTKKPGSHGENRHK